MTYGTGQVSGNIVTDDIVVAGLALKAHTFGVATTESVEFSDNSTPFDGLMGLAQSVSFFHVKTIDQCQLKYFQGPLRAKDRNSY